MGYQKIQIWSNRDNALLDEFTWCLLRTISSGSSWQSLDIGFQLLSSASAAGLPKNLEDISVLQLDHEHAPTEISPASFGSPKAFEFFVQCLQAARESGPGCKRLGKLLVPLEKGYIARADIIPLRLQDSQYIEKTFSFAEPLQSYNGGVPTSSDANNLPNLFRAATAGLILSRSLEQNSEHALEALSHAVESDLENRLSFPWIQSGEARRQTLVLVDANSAHPDEGGAGFSLYFVAKELGIDLVVLDNPGHWLEGPEFAHWRKAFIPTRLTKNLPKEDVADRIFESVKAYGMPVDGIVTFMDLFWVSIAHAAQRLGLQMASADAFRIATNKYLTSKLVGHEAYRASSLDEALDIARVNNLPYPLIIKPCNGWSSEGVSRVDSLEELTTAVKVIDTSRHGYEFVMEKYCEGPEVDVNFVLLDGEVLFFEVCDDFPKSADINGPDTGSHSHFHEQNSVYPSALPPQEIDLLRKSFLDTLLKLGLKDGIMHLEGRVESSSVVYKTKNGVLDLYSSDARSTSQQQPRAWLIEINPRPLGTTGSYIIESTYGIEYWGLALLIAVGDKTRVRALSQPFKHGAQYTCVMVFISNDYPSSCQGIFDSDDICTDLMARRPDLVPHISRCACFVKRGQRVPHPSTGRNSFLAYFNVFSRTGRQEALDLSRQVREEVRYSFI